VSFLSCRSLGACCERAVLECLLVGVGSVLCRLHVFVVSCCEPRVASRVLRGGV
jgi:hypothetical protein